MTTESFHQYIKIRTFLGYRPNEILQELQDAFGDQVPSYANIQRWSKRFREADDSPLGTPMTSQIDVGVRSSRSSHTQINDNAKRSQTKIPKMKKRSSTLNKSRAMINE